MSEHLAVPHSRSCQGSAADVPGPPRGILLPLPLHLWRLEGFGITAIVANDLGGAGLSCRDTPSRATSANLTRCGESRPFADVACIHGRSWKRDGGVLWWEIACQAKAVVFGCKAEAPRNWWALGLGQVRLASSQPALRTDSGNGRRVGQAVRSQTWAWWRRPGAGRSLVSPWLPRPGARVGTDVCLALAGCVCDR